MAIDIPRLRDTRLDPTHQVALDAAGVAVRHIREGGDPVAAVVAAVHEWRRIHRFEPEDAAARARVVNRAILDVAAAACGELARLQDRVQELEARAEQRRLVDITKEPPDVDGSRRQIRDSVGIATDLGADEVGA